MRLGVLHVQAAQLIYSVGQFLSHVLKTKRKHRTTCIGPALKALGAASPRPAVPVNLCITHLTLYYLPPEHTLSHYWINYKLSICIDRPLVIEQQALEQTQHLSRGRFARPIFWFISVILKTWGATVATETESIHHIAGDSFAGCQNPNPFKKSTNLAVALVFHLLKYLKINFPVKYPHFSESLCK